MARDFKTLVRINDWEVDQKRRFLAEQLRLLENLMLMLENLEDELAREQAFAATNPIEGGMTYGAYAEQAIQRRENFIRRIGDQEREVANAREQLRLAFLEFKKFEITEERRVARVEDEQNRTEQLDLDEIGVMAFNRKRRK
ncbi:MAG: flagellar FliJ family protein [Rhodospirillales bacterium]